jgi:hypothetical protein
VKYCCRHCYCYYISTRYDYDSNDLLYFVIMSTLLLPCVCRQGHGVPGGSTSGAGRDRRNCGSRGAGRRGCAHKVSCSLLVGVRLYLFKTACVLILFAYISKYTCRLCGGVVDVCVNIARIYHKFV